MSQLIINEVSGYVNPQCCDDPRTACAKCRGVETNAFGLPVMNFAIGEDEEMAPPRYDWAEEARLQRQPDSVVVNERAAASIVVDGDPGDELLAW